jgi:hypothetical protein
MERKLWLALACATLAAAITGVVASASSVDTKLQIGFSLQFTGPDSAAGAFVASGAIRDSGTAAVTDLMLTPQGNQDDARLTGRQTFVGQEGSITTTFRGLAGPLTDVPPSGEGDGRHRRWDGRVCGNQGACDLPRGR